MVLMYHKITMNKMVIYICITILKWSFEYFDLIPG